MTAEATNPTFPETNAEAPTSSVWSLPTDAPPTDAPPTDLRPPTSDCPWTTVIRPRRSLLDLRLGELWQCRDLISLFVWRDFVAVYKQTILGPLWHIIQPLLTTLTFTLIFGQVAQLSTDGAPQFLFYMSGTVIWMYFSTCLTKTATTFVSNSSLYGKVYFHRLSIPISVVISNLISFAIQFGVFLFFLGVYAARGQVVAPNAWILLTPLLLVMLAGLGLGFGIIVSALTTRYRDLVQLVAFGVQLWMYATPVVYPVSIVPARFQWVLLINPVAPIVESFRYAFLGSGTVSLAHLSYSAAFTVAVLAVGTVLFNRVEQTFMDTV
jgi:lipopolysaccharide transport system permease protein